MGTIRAKVSPSSVLLAKKICLSSSSPSVQVTYVVFPDTASSGSHEDVDDEGVELLDQL